MENLLNQYEFTDDQGNPITDGLMDLVKNPSREYGFSHVSSEVEPDKYFDSVQEILERTDETEGQIYVMEQYVCEFGDPPNYAIDGGHVVDISNLGLMWHIGEVYFKLKQFDVQNETKGS